MRTVAIILIILAASTASAKWKPCDSCAPPSPTVIVSGIGSLPLYSGRVRFGSEVKEGGVARWAWLRVDPAPACTSKQLSDPSDRLACASKVGEVLLRTGRIRDVPVAAARGVALRLKAYRQ